NLANLYYGRKDYVYTLQILKKIKPETIDKTGLRFKFYKLAGLALVKDGKHTKALQSLNKAAAIRSSDFDINYYIAEINRRLKKNQEAWRYAEKALYNARKKDDLAAVNFQLANIAITEKDYNKARKYMQQYLQYKPKDTKNQKLLKKLSAYVFFDQGNEAYKKEQYNQAVDYFKKAAESYPPPVKPVFKIMLAKAYYMAGEKAEAEKRKKYLQQSLEIAEDYKDNEAVMLDTYELLYNIYTQTEEFDKAKEINEEKKELLGDVDYDYYFNSAYNYELQKRFKKALANYKKAQSMHESSKHINKIVLMLKNIITEHINSATFKAAVPYVNELEKNYKNFPGVENLLTRFHALKKEGYLQSRINEAEKLYKNHNYQKALTVYREIYKLAPDQEDLLYSIATCYLNLDKINRAAGFYESDADQHKNFNAVQGHFFCLNKLQKYNEIIAAADKYFDIFTKPEEQIFLIKKKALALINLDRLAFAEKMLLEQLKDYSANSTLNLLTGNCYYLKKEYYQAESYYQKVLQVNKKKEVAYINLGVVKYKKGEYNKAVSHLKKARSLINKQKILYLENINFYLALSYYKLNNKTAAQSYIKKTLSLYNQRDNTTRADYITYIWWYSEIHAAVKANLRNAALKNRILKYLEICKNNKINKNIAYNASTLKVLLLPEARETLNYNVKNINSRPPVFAAELYIYQDKENALQALNEQSGAVEWSYDTRAPLSCPMQYSKLLYAGLENGFVIGLDINRGNEIFKIKEYAQDLVPYKKDILFVNTKIVRANQDGTIYKKELPLKHPQQIYSGGKYCVVKGKHGSVLFDPSDGSVFKTITHSNALTAGAADNYFYYVKPEDRKVYIDIFSVLNGTLIKSIYYGRDFNKKTVFHIQDKKFICVMPEGGVKTYNITSGSRLWKNDVDQVITDSSLFYKDLLLTAASGQCFKLNSSTGKIVWQNKLQTDDNSFATFMIRKQ
ncbi:MAG TPA: PQQ-binding-like beta-propeller repeat protein, partial [Spirochaetota bacterium]|nr:PQQ-binding-like beta-propeller repeat protein [Spirochaetota bacterium]